MQNDDQNRCMCPFKEGAVASGQTVSMFSMYGQIAFISAGGSAGQCEIKTLQSLCSYRTIELAEGVEDDAPDVEVEPHAHRV